MWQHGCRQRVADGGYTPLFAAAAQGREKTLRLLLEAGAPIAMRDRAEQSALHFCARSGDAETMKVLAAAARR